MENGNVFDTVNPTGLANYMRLSTDENDWNKRCDAVKKFHNGDYPSFWYVTCIASGLIDEVLGQGASQIKMEIVTFSQEKVRRGKLLQEMIGDFNEDR